MKNPVATRIALVCGLLICGVANAQTIRIKGSDTLGAKLVPQLCEAYKTTHPDVKFEIAAEGSSTAFPALVIGSADVGMSSRKATAQEMAAAQAKGIKLIETLACRDMLVVVVNKGNKVQNLTKEQVAKIFTGAVKDWSEVGGDAGEIVVFTRNTASGTYRDWQRMAMGGKDYAGTARKLSGGDSPVQEVAANQNSIAYVGLAYAKSSGIHPVSIEGVEPVAEKAKEYAYSRECYYYLKEGGLAATKEFVDFAIGKEGKKIVESLGFVAN